MLILIIGAPGKPYTRNRKRQPLSWYPPSKEAQMKSDDSYYSPIRINGKEEPSSKRNTQSRHRIFRNPSNAGDENSELSFFGKDSKGQDTDGEKDPNKRLVKRDSRYKIYKNFDNDDPDLSFFKKNSRYQSMKYPDNEDSDLFKKDSRPQVMKDNDNEDSDQNYPMKDSSRRRVASRPDYNSDSFKKDSRPQIMNAHDNEDPDQNYSKDSKRHVVSRQDYDYPPSDDYIKDSKRRISANSENLYDSEYDTPENEDKVQNEVTQANSDYEYPEEDGMPMASAQTKVKREELTPAVYNQISEAMQKELQGMLGSNSTNPCKNCGALQAENDQLKSQIENESNRCVVFSNLFKLFKTVFPSMTVVGKYSVTVFSPGMSSFHKNEHKF